MIQVVEYKVEDNILIVGFRVDNFIVYSSIANEVSKSKAQLLQLAYEKVKNTIDYEKTLSTHSFTTNKTGEKFTPQPAVVRQVNLLLNKYLIQFDKEDTNISIPFTVMCKDQYGNSISGVVVATTSYGSISGNTVVIPKVNEFTIVTITIQVGSIIVNKTIEVFPYVPIVIEDNPILNVLDRMNTLDEENNNLLLELDTVKNINNDLSNTLNVLNYNSIDMEYVLELDFRLSMVELGL